MLQVSAPSSELLTQSLPSSRLRSHKSLLQNAEHRRSLDLSPPTTQADVVTTAAQPATVTSSPRQLPVQPDCSAVLAKQLEASRSDASLRRRDSQDSILVSLTSRDVIVMLSQRLLVIAF